MHDPKMGGASSVNVGGAKYNGRSSVHNVGGAFPTNDQRVSKDSLPLE